MKKQAYYFPHDSNARNDDKILELRASLGFEGYGIYWAIVEVLRDQTGYQFRSNAIAMLGIAISCEKKLLEDVVSSCLEIGLFVEKDGYFFSESLKSRMQGFDEKRAKRVSAGRKGGKAKALSNAKANAKALPEKKVSKTEASKVKKSKEDNNINTPLNPPVGGDGVSFSKKCEYFIELFNATKGNGTPTRYKLTEKVKRQLQARIKEGYTSDDFKKAILNCKSDPYHIETGLKHLTPEFITRADKLERHLNNETAKPKFHPGLPHGL